MSKEKSEIEKAKELLKQEQEKTLREKQEKLAKFLKEEGISLQVTPSQIYISLIPQEDGAKP